MAGLASWQIFPQPVAQQNLAGAMDIYSLQCVIEILGILIIVAAAAVIRNWAAIRRSLGAAGETTLASRPQWAAILTGILGANLGYLLPVGIFTLAWSRENPPNGEAFMIPAAVVAYLCCAVPAYLPIGAVSGLLIYRFTQRKSIGSRAAFILGMGVSSFLGALIAVPLYLVGLLAAAL